MQESPPGISEAEVPAPRERSHVRTHGAASRWGTARDVTWGKEDFLLNISIFSTTRKTSVLCPLCCMNDHKEQYLQLCSPGWK